MRFRAGCATTGAVLLALAGLCNGIPPLVGPALAQTAPSPAVPQPTPKPDPAFEAARRAFEALPDAERQRIQDALAWTGDLTGSADGTFGRRTYDAIMAYQRRMGAEPTGALDDRARTGLLQTARRAQDAAGFKIATDPATGLVLGIPERVLPKRDVNPRGGSRWQSADGKITLDTRAIPIGETDLAAHYERNLAIQVPGRQVTYKVLRPDFFVIAGETATGKFYMRYASGPTGLRGFSIGYDKSVAPDFERSIIAISNSFQPFPDPARIQAAATAAGVANAAAAAPPLPPRPPAPPPKRPVLIATGLVIAPGQAVTGAAVDGCAELRAEGAAARVARSDASGLRLLAVEGGPKPAALAAADNPPAADAPVLVAAIAMSFGPPAPVVAPGTIGADGSVSAPLQAGAGGAPVFDRSGALIGLVAAAPAAKRQVAGLVPPNRYPTLGTADIARVTGRDLPASTGGAERSAADLMTLVGGALIAIECVQ